MPFTANYGTRVGGWAAAGIVLLIVIVVVIVALAVWWPMRDDRAAKRENFETNSEKTAGDKKDEGGGTDAQQKKGAADGEKASTPSKLTHFQNSLAAERYQSLRATYGKPFYVVDKPGGVAVWRNADYFEEIVVKDESIAHAKPEPHCDFLYATVKVHVPDEALPAVLMLSQSVMYDRLKNQLTARCHFMGASVATLKLALEIAEEPERADELYEAYGGAVKRSMKEQAYESMYKELGDHVATNQSTFADSMPNEECTMDGM